MPKTSSKTAPRPHVTCHMLGSVDGRIVQKIWALKDSARYFEETAEKIKVDAWVVGRTTMQEFSSKKQRPRTGTFEVPPGEFVAKKSKTYAVAIDPSGKCRWDGDMVSTEHVIEVLTEQVPAEYLHHLRSKGVSYVFGGKTELDLALVLRKLGEHFGIRRVRLDGGGHMNGSFLKAGLVDELSLVLAPLADGTIGTPSVFDVEQGYGRRKATHFKLRSVRRFEENFLWMRYEVVSSRASTGSAKTPRG